jgi:hypothetical protein
MLNPTHLRPSNPRCRNFTAEDAYAAAYALACEANRASLKDDKRHTLALYRAAWMAFFDVSASVGEGHVRTAANEAQSTCVQAMGAIDRA